MRLPVRAALRVAAPLPFALASLGLALLVASTSSACGDLVTGSVDGDGGPDGAGEVAPDGEAPDAGEPEAGGGAREKLLCDQSRPYPQYLGCTGLYADWQADRIAPEAKEYKPAWELWSDGAEKTRWIRLPPGKKIDVTDLNEWKFPVDTRVWKEFRLVVNGKPHRIETRFLWKISEDQWVRATYRWNEAETNAIDLVEGEQGVLGTTYEVPSQSQCTTCHKGRKDTLLGFEAVALANDGATGLTYEGLRAADLLSGAAPPGKPNLAVPGGPTEVAALGYLHMNCGTSCHSGASTADATQCRMPLRLDVLAVPQSLPTRVMDLSAAKNTVGVGLVNFSPPTGELARKCRVLPGDPAESALHWRASRRDANPEEHVQMPSFGSHQVDAKAMETLAAWIRGMTPDAGYPAVDPDAGTCPRPN